jgi:hypothetical protein
MKEIPVEMIREVPLTTHKETIREVPQKETIQIEKLVELQTAHEVIKTSSACGSHKTAKRSSDA